MGEWELETEGRGGGRGGDRVSSLSNYEDNAIANLKRKKKMELKENDGGYKWWENGKEFKERR